jgi:hypothetical protein
MAPKPIAARPRGTRTVKNAAGNVRKQKAATGVRAPAGQYGANFNGQPLFTADDLPDFASKSGLIVKSEVMSCDMLAHDLRAAFAYAHMDACRASKTPPIGELRKGLNEAARAGRAFLLALGTDTDPEMLLASSYSGMLDQSGILRELVGRASPDLAEMLHKEIVETYAPQYQMSVKARREGAASQMLVNQARGMAYFILATEAARDQLPPPRRRGPIKNAFAPALLASLIRVYRYAFGEMPSVKRRDGEVQIGPSVKWLQCVLERALERLPKSGYELIISGDDSSKAVSLQDEIERMTNWQPATLARAFETAIADVGH